MVKLLNHTANPSELSRCFSGSGVRNPDQCGCFLEISFHSRQIKMSVEALDKTFPFQTAWTSSLFPGSFQKLIGIGDRQLTLGQDASYPTRIHGFKNEECSRLIPDVFRRFTRRQL